MKLSKIDGARGSMSLSSYCVLVETGIREHMNLKDKIK